MKVEVDVLGSPSLTVLAVSVDVKHHVHLLREIRTSTSSVTLRSDPCASQSATFMRSEKSTRTVSRDHVRHRDLRVS